MGLGPFAQRSVGSYITIMILLLKLALGLASGLVIILWAL